MSSETASPLPAFESGSTIRGFRFSRVEALPEIRATAYEAVHPATGARLLHLHCRDTENFFAITFRTPPADSTGVAHILEHSVLAGSEKYPVKDAFNELSKGSLRTFLNAFTAPEFTCYPVASQVRADFYNLASVYTDLVLRPLLKVNTFRQEGHHLEVTEEGNLHISGIVYNEMKGVFTSPEAVSERTTLQGLFPDTPYGVESGGDPESIPDLTYEAFSAFHRRFYSPSNARFFFYGNLPTADHLAFLEEQLAGIGPVEVDSAVPDQTRWTEPRRIQEVFPIGPEDSESERTTVNLAWLTAGVDSIEERLILQVLEEALIGNAAAPLRKALIDSGLGQDLSPASGLQTWFRQIPFVVGLRGTDPEKEGEITKLALSTLERIGREGLSGDLLEAAFHQVEFKGLEITRQPYSFPLILLFRALGTWLHDGDPLLPLRFPTLMAALRERWGADPDLFRRSVQRWLVENPHRLCAVITPSRTLSQEQDARLQERLARMRALMTEKDLARVRTEAEALSRTQRAKEAPEALATLPTLRLDQIPSEVETIPTTERIRDGLRVLEHEVFSNGIAYLDLAFDVSHVPEDLQPYLPLLGAVSSGMGAAGLDYEAFATRKAFATGALFHEIKARERMDGAGPLQILSLRTRALNRNIPRMMGILRDIVAAGDLSDSDRLRDILSEERNDIRARVAPAGHIFSQRLAASSLSLAARREEQWHGAGQVLFLNRLVTAYDERKEEVQEKLARLRDLVFRRSRAILNLTGDASSLVRLEESMDALISALPAGAGPAAFSVTAGSHAAGSQAGALPANVAVPIPGKVCYVARVLPVPRHNDPGAPVVSVLSHELGDGVLYQRIRVEGGAYGGHSGYNSNLGLLSLTSYRDPNLEKTIEVYDRCLDEFTREELDSEAVRKAVIGTIGSLDPPMDPSTKGSLAMERVLSGLNDADRQRFRESVLAMDAATLRRGVEEILRPAMERSRQAVFAPKARIEAANATLSSGFEILGLD